MTSLRAFADLSSDEVETLLVNPERENADAALADFEREVLSGE